MKDGDKVRVKNTLLTGTILQMPKPHEVGQVLVRLDGDSHQGGVSTLGTQWFMIWSLEVIA